MNEEQLCRGLRKDGTPCRARALPGKTHCFAHDDDLRDKRQEAYLKGGRNKATAVRVERMVPRDLKPILTLLIDGMRDVRDGILEPQRYTAMASGAGAISRLYGVVELEQTVAALEARLNGNGSGHAS